MATTEASTRQAADPASEDQNGHLIRIGPRADLRGVTVVSGGRHGIAVFPSSVSEAVYAVDNRCPHMGFPLHKGSVADGILTCHWHHARFDLESGGTFDPWADDVQTYATLIEDGIVYVDPRPRGNRAAHARARLRDGLEQNLGLVVVKNVLTLHEADVPASEMLAIGGRFGATYRRGGWASGLTILTALGNVLPVLRPEDRTLALYHGLVNVARDCAGQPPRFALDPLPTQDSPLPADRLKGWFRRFIEVRDADGAERTLLTAIDGWFAPGNSRRYPGQRRDRPLLSRRRAHPRLRQQGVRAARSDRVERGSNDTAESRPRSRHGAPIRGAERLATPGRPDRPARTGVRSSARAVRRGRRRPRLDRPRIVDRHIAWRRSESRSWPGSPGHWRLERP